MVSDAARMKQREATARYRAAHPDRVRAARLAKYQINKEILKKKSAAWRLKNPDRLKASMADWRDRNREKINSDSREYYQKNMLKKKQYYVDARKKDPEKFRAKTRAYDRAHPDKARIRCANRQARKRSGGGSFSLADIKNILALQKNKCPICAVVITTKYHIDHNVPLALGGSNGKENIQLLCPPCNRTKSHKDPIAFMQEKGFLI